MIYLNKLTFRVDSSDNDVSSVGRKASFDSLDEREVAHPLGLWQAQESRQATGFRVPIFKQHGRTLYTSFIWNRYSPAWHKKQWSWSRASQPQPSVVTHFQVCQP